MGQCVGCVKYLLFIFNFALWLFGCALLAVGIWMMTDESADHHVQRMTTKVDEEYQINYSATGDTDVSVTIAHLFIVFGIIVIIITVIGCCAAVKENTCLLLVFAACLFAMMVALLTIGIWACVKRANVEAHTDALKEKSYANVEKAVKRYYQDTTSEEFMNRTQEKFQCCGANNAELDYPRNRAPCPPEYLGRRCTDRYFMFAGDEIEAFLKSRYTVIAAVALTIGVCLAIGVFLTLFLFSAIKRSSSVRVS